MNVYIHAICSLQDPKTTLVAHLILKLHKGRQFSPEIISVAAATSPTNTALATLHLEKSSPGAELIRVFLQGPMLPGISWSLLQRSLPLTPPTPPRVLSRFDHALYDYVGWQVTPFCFLMWYRCELRSRSFPAQYSESKHIPTAIAI